MACLKNTLCPKSGCKGKLGSELHSRGLVMSGDICKGCKVASTIGVITILALPFCIGIGFGLTERFMTQGASAEQSGPVLNKFAE